MEYIPLCIQIVIINNFYPLTDESVVWEYDKANKDLTAKAIDAFDWDKKLSERCVNDQVLLFNETLLHIMNNFIPDKVFDGKKPPWFYRKITKLIKHKNEIYKDTPDHKSNHNFLFHFQYIRDLINTKIDQAKSKYHEICHISYLIKVSILKYGSLPFKMAKQYLVYHQYTIKNINLKLSLQFIPILFKVT